MRLRTAITIDRSEEEVRERWATSEHRPRSVPDEAVRFAPAPGDRGTEVHVDLERRTTAGRVGELVQRVAGAAPMARVKEELRRFKAHVETGEVPRSDGAPEGERLDRKFKHRPAQPLADRELERAGER